MAVKLNMDARKAEVLLRAALLDDAENMNERIAALIAEITVHDDESVWIELDIDLWPEDKLSPAVEAIAKMLLLEIDWGGTQDTWPFAWVGIGEHTGNTGDYYQLVLTAYGKQETSR